ncbi:MAG: hypothetical protein R3B06_28660 [Kofleriaceae bacterium]
MPRLALVTLIAAGAALGCERPGADPRPIDRSLVAVGAQVTIRTAPVGVGAFEAPATFALVDADNHADVAAEVTLGGVLVDADGHEVASLRPASLIIPPGGQRTFALVDRGSAVRSTAVGARVDVRGAREPRFPEPVRVTDGHIYRDGDRAVVAAMLENTSDRPVIAMVMAGFHDGDGRPLTRPFAPFVMGAGSSHPSRFVGPDGSRSGYIFIGDVTYCPTAGCAVKWAAPQPPPPPAAP